MNLPFLLPKIDHDRVVQAILAAEAKTSGEIRVMVVRHKVQDPVAAAQAYFDKLGMASSPHRNSVLILVAPRSRRFAVIGDSGPHDKCGDAFWSSLAETMGGYFKRREFTEGIVHGVDRAGELLARTFPRTAGDGSAGAPSVTEVD
jgi:uncharacterized membrane protein